MSLLSNIGLISVFLNKQISFPPNSDVIVQHGFCMAILMKLHQTAIRKVSVFCSQNRRNEHIVERTDMPNYMVRDVAGDIILEQMALRVNLC